MRNVVLATTLLLVFTGNASAGWKDLFNSSTLYWENDNFGVGRKSDRFYTNGVRYTLLLSDSTIANWQWPSTVRDAVWTHLGGDQNVQPIAAVNVVFGQNFYTPQDITMAAPQPLDRPWAGVLYVGISEAVTDADQQMQHLLEVNIGVLGQAAGAQRTQKFVHNDLGFSGKDPQGWPNQLENEPAFTLRYQQMRRYPLTSREDLLDVVPAFGGQLGSPQTFVNAGGTLRFGHHISGLPVALIPGVATGKAVDRLEAYVFAGGEARWIPFNATLDGAPGPKRFVTDLRAGVSARYKWVRLTYSVVERSKEFDVPPGAIANQRFGSVALTIEPFEMFK